MHDMRSVNSILELDCDCEYMTNSFGPYSAYSALWKAVRYPDFTFMTPKVAKTRHKNYSFYGLYRFRCTECSLTIDDILGNDVTICDTYLCLEDYRMIFFYHVQNWYWLYLKGGRYIKPNHLESFAEKIKKKLEVLKGPKMSCFISCSY